MDAAISYHLSKQTFSINTISGFIFTWSIVTGLIALAFFYALFKWGYLDTTDSRILFISWLFITGNLFITILQSVFYAQNNFIFPNLVSIIFNLALGLLLVVGFYQKWMIDIVTFFQLYAYSFFLQGIIFFSVLLWRNKISLFKSFNLRIINVLYKYASVAFASNLVFFLVYRIDYWFVNKYCDADLLGNYIQVSKLVQVFLIIPAGIASVIFPFSASGKTAMTQKLMQLSRLLVSFFFIIIVMLAITGKWLFPFVFGSSFDKMYQPFLWLSPGIICLAVIALLGAYFSGKNMTRINLTGGIIALVIMITGDIILIPLLQIKGAAIASSISYACFLIYLLYCFNKNETESAGGFFICKKLDWKNVISFLQTLRK
jgi:O-antigen/teichoic acid export membrane protein